MNVNAELDQIFVNMGMIVARERLVKGFYIDPDTLDDELTGALCGGHQFCAVGSLWAAAGIEPVNDGYGKWELPGTLNFERESFLAQHPILGDAFDYLNEAAREYATDKGLALNEGYAAEFEDPLEALFEGHFDGDNLREENPKEEEEGTRTINSEDLLQVIARARKMLQANA